MKNIKVAVLVGSLRKAAYSKMIANTLKEVAPSSLTLDMIDLSQLPMYNQDYDDEGNPPLAWQQFRTAIQGYDALLFVTPEYNRSTTAVLKNALDVGSRPYGKSVWDKKPGAVISVSPGALGGFGANHHLRQILVVLNIPTMAQPEAYIGSAFKLFNDKGEMIDLKTKGFLKSFMEAYATWAEKNI